MSTNVWVDHMPGVRISEFDPVVDVSVVGIEPVTVNPVTVSALPDMHIADIGPMGPLTMNPLSVGISSLPDVNLRIREIPSIRAHIPANFRLGLSVFGIELAALNLCGEAQIITEPYVPNPCEGCGGAVRTPPPRNNDVGAVIRLANR